VVDCTENGNKLLATDFHKVLEISGLAKRQLASHEELCYMGLLESTTPSKEAY
jgi:hypothetical protein